MARTLATIEQLVSTLLRQQTALVARDLAAFETATREAEAQLRSLQGCAGQPWCGSHRPILLRARALARTNQWLLQRSAERARELTDVLQQQQLNLLEATC